MFSNAKLFLAKLIFSFVLFVTVPLVASSQGIMPLIYQPSNNNSNQTEVSTTVDAYFISYGNFVRIKIAVSENQFGLYVTKYLYSNGYTVEWRNCSRSQVHTVSNFSDGRVIAENFYYKAYIYELGKWVYF